MSKTISEAIQVAQLGAAPVQAEDLDVGVKGLFMLFHAGYGTLLPTVAKKLMALQGKTEGSPGYTVVPGEEYLAPDGLTKLRGPALVLDNRTGQVVDMSAQIRRGERKGARPEKYELGRTYVVGDRSVRVVSFDNFGQPQFEEVK